MTRSVPVDAWPTTSWHEPRPSQVHPQLWAHDRPTLATLAELGLPDGSVVTDSDGRLLGWESGDAMDVDLAQLWLQCARLFPVTGLWPITDTFPRRTARAWVPPRVIWSDDPMSAYAIPTDVYDTISRDPDHHYFEGLDREDWYDELVDFGIAHPTTTLAPASPLPDDLLGRLQVPTCPRG